MSRKYKEAIDWIINRLSKHVKYIDVIHIYPSLTKKYSKKKIIAELYHPVIRVFSEKIERIHSDNPLLCLHDGKHLHYVGGTEYYNHCVIMDHYIRDFWKQYRTGQAFSHGQIRTVGLESKDYEDFKVQSAYILHKIKLKYPLLEVKILDNKIDSENIIYRSDKLHKYIIDEKYNYFYWRIDKLIKDCSSHYNKLIIGKIVNGTALTKRDLDHYETFKESYKELDRIKSLLKPCNTLIE